jgi:hypothetical protein
MSVGTEMNESADSAARAAVEGLEGFGLELLAGAFPRLREGHPDRPGTASEWAGALRAAAVEPAAEPATAWRRYVEKGELAAARALLSQHASAIPDADLNREAGAWQRRVEDRLREARRRADYCDRSAVPCAGTETWLKAEGELERRIAPWVEHPGLQVAEIDAFLARSEAAVRGRQETLAAEVAARRAEWRTEAAAPGAAEALRLLDQAERLVAQGDLLVGLIRLRDAEEQLGRRPAAPAYDTVVRRPLPSRPAALASDNPFSQLRSRPGLLDGVTPQTFKTGSFPAMQAEYQNSLRQPASYVKTFLEWLGLSRRAGLVFGTAAMPRLLETNNFTNLDTSKVFYLAAEPRRGTPWYADSAGRPRIVAILCAFKDFPQGKVNDGRARLAAALGGLRAKLEEPGELSESERRFHDHGLVIVLMPGRSLTGFTAAGGTRALEQAAADSGFGRQRVAFLDDLDLVRLLHLPEDDRRPGLLELALPRFPGAQETTYRAENAINRHMFFGREGQLDELRGKTVLFGGRKMGKSSLLKWLLDKASQDESQDERAVYVSAAGITPRRSWELLDLIAVRTSELLQGLDGAASNPSAGWSIGDLKAALLGRADPVEVSAGVRDRFRRFVGEALAGLERAGSRRLLVLVDEADNFAHAETAEAARGDAPGRPGEHSSRRAAVSWFLRDLEDESAGRLRFLFAGYDEIGRTRSQTHSAFSHWRGFLDLEPLTREACTALIRVPLLALGIRVDDALCDRIRDYAGGHASLIQLLCHHLILEVRRREQPRWPLNDVDLRPEHVEDVVSGCAGFDFRQAMADAWGLNLNIARTYPLEAVFTALVSPYGPDNRRRPLDLDRFEFGEVVAHLEGTGLPTVEVEESLRLLERLGVLERLEADSGARGRSGAARPGGTVYRVRARHFANHLRTRNDFSARLAGLLRELADPAVGREATPRLIWTVPTARLEPLLDRESVTAVFVGLPGSGRENLGRMLAPDSERPPADGAHVARFDPALSALPVAAWLEREAGAAGGRPARLVVHDGGGRIPWSQARGLLQSFESLPRLLLFWISGPAAAWDLVRDDVGFALLADERAIGMQALSPTELANWGVRRGSGAAGPLVFPAKDCAAILERIGGLLPVLEFWRSHIGEAVPDLVRVEHADAFVSALRADAGGLAEYLAADLAKDIPADLRVLLHRAFAEAERYGYRDLPRGDLMELLADGPGADDAGAAIDAGLLLGFLQDQPGGRVRVPFESALGLLVRHPEFPT